jgi:Protein of unknown function (DUF1569)
MARLATSTPSAHRRKSYDGAISALGAARIAFRDRMGRVGHHPAFGALNLRQWVQFFLMHEAHHLYVALVRSRG